MCFRKRIRLAFIGISLPEISKFHPGDIPHRQSTKYVVHLGNVNVCGYVYLFVREISLGENFHLKYSKEI